MSDREQSRNAVHRGTEIVAFTLVRGAGVDCCPDAHAVNGREIFGRNRSLRREHRGNGIFRARERHAERVADGLENGTAGFGEDGAHHVVVAPHGLQHAGAIAVPTFGATFDIGEREGDRAGRQRPGAAEYEADAAEEG